MHSKSMHVLVTFNRGVCFTTINFSLRNISVPCYLRLPCNCVLSEFFIFRFNKGTTQLSSSEHLALWSPSLISQKGLRGQQGSTGVNRGTPYTGRQSSAFPPLGRDQGQGRLRPSALFVCCLWTSFNDFRCNPCNGQV